MWFTCARFPVGQVPIRTVAGVVHFQDGAAYVADPVDAAALADVPDAFGIGYDAGELADLIGDALADDIQDEGPEGEPDDEPEAAEVVDGGADEATVEALPQRPGRDDAKAVWVDWAQAEHGLSEADAEAMTKAALMALGQAEG